MAMIIVADVK